MGLVLMLMTPLHMNVYFGRAPYESSLFDYENDHVGFFSMKYSRPAYIWILALLNLTIHLDSLVFLTIALFLPLLYSLGWLSNPFVTLMYLLE